jgi:hypothetical protein
MAGNSSALRQISLRAEHDEQGHQQPAPARDQNDTRDTRQVLLPEQDPIRRP